MSIFEEYEKKQQEYQKYREDKAVYDSKIKENLTAYHGSLKLLEDALAKLSDDKLKQILEPVIAKYSEVNEDNIEEAQTALSAATSQLELYIRRLLGGNN